MNKLVIWDKKTSLIYNNGVEKTAEEVIQDYPVTKYGTTIIEYIGDSPVMVGFWDIGSLKKTYNLPDDLTDEETIKAAENAINNPPAPIASPEERIAAALEFQNLMSL